MSESTNNFEIITKNFEVGQHYCGEGNKNGKQMRICVQVVSMTKKFVTIKCGLGTFKKKIVATPVGDWFEFNPGHMTCKYMVCGEDKMQKNDFEKFDTDRSWNLSQESRRTK